MTMKTPKTQITRRDMTLGTAAFVVGASGLTSVSASSPLGVARTLAVNSQNGPRFGTKSYPASLPLADGEVVLTFDDGPIPSSTGRVLDALAQENVRATFFLIGRNAQAHPEMVRRMVAQGHTLANHTMNHPWTMRERSFEVGLREINQGKDAIEQAVGRAIAPFFRFPGFADTPELLAELSRRNTSVWGTDIWASDWNLMTPDAQLNLLYSRVRKARKGIILMHDIRPQTASMLPSFLTALKQDGFKIVHAVAG